jgi:hypothetical protein
VAGEAVSYYVWVMTQAFSRRNILALGAASIFTRSAFSAAKRPVILELFTSQGCSSCPPADAYIQTLIGKPGVVPLTYHVDYWDYLGWRDTLGSAEYSQRQYDYAQSRGDKNVYTPQIVINGQQHFVGSQRSSVSDGIGNARSDNSAEWVEITMSENKTDVMIDIAAGAPGKEATLWLMAYAPSVSVEIKKGENAGSTVTYKNVVRKMVPASMWHGEAAKLVLPRSSVIPEECKGWVALLQEGKVGPIIGAAAGGVAKAQS